MTTALPPAAGPPRDRESGQVLVLAAIGMLALVLMVITTVNLGEAVHERIKLQNTADSAAYTLAAMEARTFNYIAFLNRTQLAHYNTAMVIQSYTTWVGFHIAMVGGAVDLVRSLNTAFLTCMVATCPACNHSCPLCCTCCGACKTFYAFTEALKLETSAVLGLAASVYQGGAMFGHLIVEAIQIFNERVIFQAQAWRALLMNANLLTGMQNYIEKNDPSLALYRGGRNVMNTLVNTALNSYEYWSAFDAGAGANPQAFAFLLDVPKLFFRSSAERQKKIDPKEDSGGEADAYRVMTQLAHATRYPRFVWDRSTSISLGGIFGASASGGKAGSTGFTEEDTGIESGEIKELLPGRPDPVTTCGRYLSSYDAAGAGASVSLGIGFMKEIVPSTGAYLADAIAGYGSSDIRTMTFGEGKHYQYDPGRFAELMKSKLGGKQLSGLKDMLSTLEGGVLDAVPKALKAVKSFNETATRLTSELMKPASDLAAALGTKAEEGLAAAETFAKEQGWDLKPFEEAKAHAKAQTEKLRGGATLEAKESAGAKTPGVTPSDLTAEQAAAASEEPGLFAVLAPYVPYLQLVYAAVQDPVMLAKMAGQMALNWALQYVEGLVMDYVKQLLSVLMKQVWDALLGGGVSHPCLAFFSALFGQALQKPQNFGTDDHVPWPGFAPYFKFAACDDRTRDFCQPSTWIFLSKPAEYLEKRKDQKWPAYARFVWEHGQYRAQIDTTSSWSNNTFMFEGPWVVSRGMAYYHRPGFWDEHPNFFNPFWRARLAPIGQKLMNYWEGFVGRQIGGSAEAMVISQVLNVVRNAQMELFTGLASSLVAH